MTHIPRDENIRRVLVKAAQDEAFFKALLDDREAALRDVFLAPEERTLLLAAGREQLAKMVAEVRKKPKSALGTFLKAGAVAAGAAAAAALLIVPSTLSAGISPEVARELDAREMLRAIAVAEHVYRNEYGTYGTMEHLFEREYISREYMARLQGDGRYELELKLEGDSFTATARHKTRPETRRAYRVGPDGEVRPVE